MCTLQFSLRWLLVGEVLKISKLFRNKSEKKKKGLLNRRDCPFEAGWHTV